jgi:hypothetical protein
VNLAGRDGCIPAMVTPVSVQCVDKMLARLPRTNVGGNNNNNNNNNASLVGRIRR